MSKIVQLVYRKKHTVIFLLESRCLLNVPLYTWEETLKTSKQSFSESSIEQTFCLIKKNKTIGKKLPLGANIA